ncbi:MAG: DUF1428 domain-containing protein [Rhizobiaceae bacterium]
MAYVDLIAAAVPTARKAEYATYAARMDRLFRQAGAIEIVDCWGDDVPEGELTSFPKAVRCAPDETVVTGWIKWPSKTARDAAWADLAKHPDMQPGAELPFDGRRLIYGGFETIVEL